MNYIVTTLIIVLVTYIYITVTWKLYEKVNGPQNFVTLNDARTYGSILYFIIALLSFAGAFFFDTSLGDTLADNSNIYQLHESGMLLIILNLIIGLALRYGHLYILNKINSRRLNSGKQLYCEINDKIDNGDIVISILVLIAMAITFAKIDYHIPSLLFWGILIGQFFTLIPILGKVKSSFIDLLRIRPETFVCANITILSLAYTYFFGTIEGIPKNNAISIVVGATIAVIIFMVQTMRK